MRVVTGQRCWALRMGHLMRQRSCAIASMVASKRHTSVETVLPVFVYDPLMQCRALRIPQRRCASLR